MLLPIRRLVRKISKKVRRRAIPLVTSYSGDAESVLQCCIAYNDLGGYCVPRSSLHRPAAQRVLSGKIWEPETIEYMVKHCGEGDIVHAGSYFGDFLPALSRACANDAKVWAFEPNLENYRCALITTFINDLRNVEIANAGLGARKGSLSMMISDASGRSLGGTSRVLEEYKGDGREELTQVEIVRLDDAVPSDRTISILQLDVEDFEQPALTGATRTIERCKPILILENLPDQHWLSENILRLGYRVARKVHANTILAIE